MNDILCQSCDARGYTAAIPCEVEECEVCNGAGFHMVECAQCLGRGSFPGKFCLNTFGLITGSIWIDLTKQLPTKIQDYAVSGNKKSRTWQLDLTLLVQQALGDEHPLDTILFIHDHTARDPRSWLKPITLMGNMAGRGAMPNQVKLQEEASYIASRHFYNWLNGDMGDVEIRPRPSLTRLFHYLELATKGVGFEVIAKQSPRGRYFTVWSGNKKLASADDHIEALYNACIALENEK